MRVEVLIVLQITIGYILAPFLFKDSTQDEKTSCCRLSTKIVKKRRTPRHLHSRQYCDAYENEIVVVTIQVLDSSR